jgi:hypothetical protein
MATAAPLASPTSNRAGANRDDLPATKARQLGPIDDRLEIGPLRGDRAAEAPRPARQPWSAPSRDPVGLLSGLDLDFDLPFLGVPVTVKPAARTTTEAESTSVIALSSQTTSTPGTVAPAVAAAAPVAVENDSEATFGVTAMMLADPSITLTPSTNFIPVNANRTSQSPWKKDEADNDLDLTGLPVVRDFDLNPMRDLSGWDGQGQPPPGAAVADPELKQVTATVANPGNPAGPIQVFVIYSDPDNNGGGWIRLWQDQSKTQQIFLTHQGNGVYQGSLPGHPTSTFYVEGIRPSKQENDVKLKVRYTAGMPGPGQPPPPPAEDETTLTVTPVVKEFSVNPKSPDSQTTFFRATNGKILGMNSGRQNADGATDPGSAEQGAHFTADLLITGAGGTGRFIQNVTNLVNGNPSAVELTNGTLKANWTLTDNLTYPILDLPTGASPPFYPSTDVIPISQDRHNFASVDTPAFFLSEQQLGIDNIVRFDLTFQARLYLAFRFHDASVYTLALANWQVIFRTELVNGALRVADTSVVSADTNPKHILSHSDPAAYWSPTFNEKITITPVA